MTIELTMLALSAALGLVPKARTWRTALVGGPRDEPMPSLTGIAGRLERALANFLETFPLFGAVVLIAHVVRHDWITVWVAQLFFGSVASMSRSMSWGCRCCAHSCRTWRRSASS
jgi:uncharacterized MAPEG superfamily protein